MTLVVPGSAQLVAGNRKLARIGVTATLGFWALFLLGSLIGLINKTWLIWIITIPVLVGVLSLLLMLYAILFAFLALDTLRLIRMNRLYSRDRWIALGGLVTAAILGTSAISWAGNTAGVSAGFIGNIFNQSGFTSKH